MARRDRITQRHVRLEWQWDRQHCPTRVVKAEARHLDGVELGCACAAVGARLSRKVQHARSWLECAVLEEVPGHSPSVFVQVAAHELVVDNSATAVEHSDGNALDVAVVRVVRLQLAVSGNDDVAVHIHLDFCPSELVLAGIDAGKVLPPLHDAERVHLHYVVGHVARERAELILLLLLEVDHRPAIRRCTRCSRIDIRAIGRYGACPRRLLTAVVVSRDGRAPQAARLDVPVVEHPAGGTDRVVLLAHNGIARCSAEVDPVVAVERRLQVLKSHKPVFEREQLGVASRVRDRDIQDLLGLRGAGLHFGSQAKQPATVVDRVDVPICAHHGVRHVVGAPQGVLPLQGIAVVSEEVRGLIRRAVEIAVLVDCDVVDAVRYAVDLLGR